MDDTICHAKETFIWASLGCNFFRFWVFQNYYGIVSSSLSSTFWHEMSQYYSRWISKSNQYNLVSRWRQLKLLWRWGTSLFPLLWFFFFWFGFYGPFKNISLISSRLFIEGGRKPENPEKNHLTIRKQNLAFPHMTRASSTALTKSCFRISIMNPYFIPRENKVPLKH